MIFDCRLEGKVAIITGGAMGIGEAIVRLFTKHGAKVIIADLADEARKTLAEFVSPFVTYVHCDVSKECWNILYSLEGNDFFVLCWKLSTILCKSIIHLTHSYIVLYLLV